MACLTTLLARVSLLMVGLSGLGCGDDETNTPQTGVTLVFEVGADLTQAESFFDVPYPSDLRRDAEGHPAVANYPNPGQGSLLAGLIANAAEADGFPVLSVTHMRFSGALATRTQAEVIAADKASPILLVDVSAGATRGELVPVVARTLEPDSYTPENMLAIAPRPGFVLRPATSYATVVMRSANDSTGAALGPSPVLERLRSNKPASGEEPLVGMYAPLWETLDQLGIAADDVAAATVFSTGTTVATTAAIGDQALAAHDVTIANLSFDEINDSYAELCLLRGEVSLPQFQAGTPPFNEQGRLVLDAAGSPVEQRRETAPVTIAIPRTPMPIDGYPLVLNIHGSGGYSVALIRPVGDDGLPGAPIGPAFPVAIKGIAMAGFAMPLNPERFPGAEETEYLNVGNLGAMRDTFRQGVIESRLMVEALEKLTIDPTLLAACAGATLPVGATAFSFDGQKLGITGQSMGGMYSNMIGSTEPKLRAAVPTGAGGHWTFFIMNTQLRDGQIPGFLTLTLGTGVELSFLHPALAVSAAGLEAGDPATYMPHLARRPLPGHPVRPIYEPAGEGDSYFPTSVYDAVAIAYGHRQAGNDVWPEMQDALRLAGLDGIQTLPQTNNVVSETGEPYTGVVAQFVADGPYDAHAIYSHRDDVKRQYSCFWDSFMKTGTATVVALDPNWQSPCP